LKPTKGGLRLRRACARLRRATCAAPAPACAMAAHEALVVDCAEFELRRI